MSRILITADDDALGAPLTARLVRLLERRGHSVQVLGDAELAALGAAALQTRLTGVAHLIHLSEAQPPLTNEDQYAGYRRNVLATRRLIEACRTQPQPPRFTLRSAVAVSPVDSYGRQKAECEDMLRASGLEHIILRIGVKPAPAPSSSLSPQPREAYLETASPDELALAFANTLEGAASADRILWVDASADGRPRFAAQRARLVLLRRALRAGLAFFGRRSTLTRRTS